jgi:phosphonate transport system substrate-binding protein
MKKEFQWTLKHFLFLGCLMLSCAIFVAWFLLRTLDAPQKHIEFDEKLVERTAGNKNKAQLRFAVATMVSPKNTFINYKQLVKLIGNEIGRNSSLIIHSSYRDVRKALQTVTVDAAFVCTGTYALCVPAEEVKIIAQPVFIAPAQYRSVIIVNASFKATSIMDLKGASFAFTDPESCTGDFVPRELFTSQGIDIRKFFSKTIYTGSHDKSVMAVANNVVDAAAVDALILYGMYPDESKLKDDIKIIWESDVFGPPPVVVPASCDENLRMSLQDTLLGLHENPYARALLKNIGIASFKKPDISDYKSILNLYKIKRESNMKRIDR